MCPCCLMLLLIGIVIVQCGGASTTRRQAGVVVARGWLRDGGRHGCRQLSMARRLLPGPERQVAPPPVRARCIRWSACSCRCARRCGRCHPWRECRCRPWLGGQCRPRPCASSPPRRKGREPPQGCHRPPVAWRMVPLARRGVWAADSGTNAARRERRSCGYCRARRVLPLAVWRLTTRLQQPVVLPQSVAGAATRGELPPPPTAPMLPLPRTTRAAASDVVSAERVRRGGGCRL